MENRKRIVITGGSTGIGFACARHLADNGYEVVITGKSQSNLNSAVKALGDSVTGFVSDTAELSEIDKLVIAVKQRFGKVDGLFINAGVFRSSGFETTSEEVFDQTMNVNFKGAYFTVQRFLPIMNNPSSIVLNTSFVVFRAFADTSVYTASKAALESVAKVWNLELASKGIRVNIISPGVTVTPIQQKSGMDDEAIKNLLDHFAKTSPIGRIVHPEDIAPVLEFLLSERSLVLRSEKIVVDGGTTM